MSDVVRVAVLALASAVGVGLFFVLPYWMLRRKARKLQEHPELLPGRKTIIVRGIVLVLLMVACFTWILVGRRWEMMPIGIIGLACGGLLLFKVVTDYPDQSS